MSAARYEELLPTDRAMCFRFGSGAFPCGPPFIVRVTRQSVRPTAPEHETRRVLCRAHYEFAVSHVPGGPSGLKARAKNAAFMALAAEHPARYQELYEQHLRACAAAEVPALDPESLLPPERMEV